MKRLARPIALVLLALAACGVTLVRAQEEGEAEWTPLFNGENLDGLQLVGIPEDTLRVEDGVLICSGSPNGYWHTADSYANYVLRFEWRYARPEGLENDADFGGNSGYLIHITGEHRVWPQCIEVQGMNRDAGNIFAIGGAAAVQALKDEQAQQAAIRPVGEWNEMEIFCRDGQLVSRINGHVVAFGFAHGEGAVTEGPIGFQSEGAEIHWRNIRIRELD